MDNRKRMNVLVIGLDGADFAHFDRYAPERLCRVPLRSQIAVTGCEWTSIYTGIPVARLGVYDCYHRPLTNPAAGLYTYNELGGYPFWEIAEAAGHRAAVCAAPACYPARPPALGWVLSGPGARDDAECFATVDPNRYPPPSASNRELPPDPYIAACWTHYLGYEHLSRDKRRRLWRFCKAVGLDGLCELARAHGRELVDYFMRNSRGCDVGFVYFRLIDLVLHTHSITVTGGAERVYRIMLDLVEELYARLEPEHLFIVSDHGGQGNTHRDVGVFAWVPTELTPERGKRGAQGNDVQLVETARERELIWLKRVSITRTPWSLGTQDVAAVFLQPLGLGPRPFDGPPYSVIDEARVSRRLQELGYI